MDKSGKLTARNSRRKLRKTVPKPSLSLADPPAAASPSKPSLSTIDLKAFLAKPIAASAAKKPSGKRIRPPQPTMKDLLGRGFLPQELPPPFNSLSLGHFIDSRGPVALPFDISQYRTSRSEVYNLARAGSFRRELV